MRAIEWDAGDIVVIDQRALPADVEFLRLRSTDELAGAIRSMAVRGAPALGIVGAMGVAQAALRTVARDAKSVHAAAEAAGEVLKATRPTAVNLAWAIDRVLERGRSSRLRNAERLTDLLVEEALAIRAEDEQACLSIAKNAIELFEPQSVVLTHCNTGALVTGGIGTALGAIIHAHESGLGIAVVATETRPLLQGSRLTAWELARAGVPNALVVDAAAPGLIARGEISTVMVGADRIVANGDVANKIGTYPLALAAKASGIPFYVLAPTSTVDLAVTSGAGIPVEERSSDEVTTVLGRLRVAPPGTQGVNPAFDVTPADLVTAIVTERGIVRPPFKRSLARLARAAGNDGSNATRAPADEARAAPSRKTSSPRKAASRKASSSRKAPPKATKKAASRKATKKTASRKASSSRSGQHRGKRTGR